MREELVEVRRGMRGLPGLTCERVGAVVIEEEEGDELAGMKRVVAMEITDGDCED